MACQSRFDAIDTVGIFRPRAADVSRCLRTERYVSACSPHVFGMFPASPRHDRLSFHHSHLSAPFSYHFPLVTYFPQLFAHVSAIYTCLYVATRVQGIHVMLKY